MENVGSGANRPIIQHCIARRTKPKQGWCALLNPSLELGRVSHRRQRHRLTHLHWRLELGSMSLCFQCSLARPWQRRQQLTLASPSLLADCPWKPPRHFPWHGPGGKTPFERTTYHCTEMTDTVLNTRGLARSMFAYPELGNCGISERKHAVLGEVDLHAHIFGNCYAVSQPAVPDLHLSSRSLQQIRSISQSSTWNSGCDLRASIT